MMRTVLAAAIAAAALVAATPAAAQTNPPTDPTIHVGDVSLIGVEALDESELRGALATRESSWLTRWMPWTERPEFDRTLFQDDLERIVVFYHDRGYPHAQIVDDDVRIDEKRHIADVTIRIEEGPVLTIDAIELEGFRGVDCS